MCFRPWARQHHRGIKAHANDQDPDQDHNDTTSVEAGSTTSGDIVHSGEMFVVHDGGTASSTTSKPGSDATKTVANDLKQWFDPNATFAGTVAGGDYNAAWPVSDQHNSPDQTTTDTTGTDLGNPVRLANYMASTFVGQGDGYGDQMIADSGESVAQQPFLTNPH